MEPLNLEENMLDIILLNRSQIPPPEIGVWSASLHKTPDMDLDKVLNIGTCNERQIQKIQDFYGKRLDNEVIDSDWNEKVICLND